VLVIYIAGLLQHQRLPASSEITARIVRPPEAVASIIGRREEFVQNKVSEITTQYRMMKISVSLFRTATTQKE
jgi:hypothetical protein